jgi:hypothetical protein
MIRKQRNSYYESSCRWICYESYSWYRHFWTYDSQSPLHSMELYLHINTARHDWNLCLPQCRHIVEPQSFHRTNRAYRALRLPEVRPSAHGASVKCLQDNFCHLAKDGSSPIEKKVINWKESLTKEYSQSLQSSWLYTTRRTELVSSVIFNKSM